MLRSDLCDFSDAYIVVKGVVTVAGELNKDKKNRDFVLKNNKTFISCIPKTKGVLIENAKDLDIVMTMYNLLEYSKNYSKTSGSLWNYYRDELTDETNDNNGPNKNVINSKSFKYKPSITGSTYNVTAGTRGYDRNKEGTKEVKVVVPLKKLGNFWNCLSILLINSEVSLALTWPTYCVITSLEKRLVTAAQGDNPAAYDNSPTGATFKITNCKLHVPVVTLSAENDIKLLEQLKIGFKRTIK